MRQLQQAVLKRFYRMMFYKIKIAFLSVVLCFFCFFSVKAELQIEELNGNLTDALGVEKTLPFSAWGDLPFDDLVEITNQLSVQKKSAWLAKLTATVLMQQTFIEQNNWSEKQSQKWLLTRLNALLSLGYPAQALMIEQLPMTSLNKDVLKLKMDALFLTEHWQEACVIALQNASEDDYFNHVQVLCLGLLDNQDKASMAFDLWQEEHPNEKTASFVMGKLLGLELPKSDKMDNLTIADVFVLRLLNAKELDEIVLPLPYQVLPLHSYSDFGSAINTRLLFERWEKSGLSETQKAYRYYLLNVYASMFLPELHFFKNDFLWNEALLQMNFSLRSLYLKDKTETQITGSDLLLGLWLLNELSLNIQDAMIILFKGGLDLKNYVLEQINS